MGLDAMTDPLVSTDWLAERLGSADLVVLDGSWHMPADNRDGRAEYTAAHIPGAIFFDIEATSEQFTDLPHMLPDPHSFVELIAPLGLSREATIVVYDSVGIFSAPRVWWTLKVMGFPNVYVLDGGLKAWLAEGRPVESAIPQPAPTALEPMYSPDLICDADDVLGIIMSDGVELVDARAAARFRGDAPEPRPGLQAGHMPGAKNLPWGGLLQTDGRMKSGPEIKAAFEQAGVDLRAPIVTTCGSGVSAAILMLGLTRMGHGQVAVYDGSWSEWGGLPGAPIATGP